MLNILQLNMQTISRLVRICGCASPWVCICMPTANPHSHGLPLITHLFLSHEDAFKEKNIWLWSVLNDT